MSGEHKAIIVVAGEGGTISLMGAMNSDGTWRYAVCTNESSLRALLDDEDASLATRSTSSPVSTIDDALVLLSRYPWAQLVPQYVDTEFAERVWDEVQKRIGRADRFALSRWKRACGCE